MNKAALVDKVNDLLGTTKVQAESVVDLIVDSIINNRRNGIV